MTWRGGKFFFILTLSQFWLDLQISLLSNSAIDQESIWYIFTWIGFFRFGHLDDKQFLTTSKLLFIKGRITWAMTESSKVSFAQILMLMYSRLWKLSSFSAMFAGNDKMESGPWLLVIILYSKLSNFGHFEQMLLNVLTTDWKK